MPKGIPKSGKRKRDNKSEEILDAAMKVFCHYGIFGTTIEKIANEAVVSTSLVLRYYKTKHEIAEICALRFMDDFNNRMFKLARKENTRYLHHVDNVFELFKASRHEWQFILVTLALNDLGREIIAKYLTKAHELVTLFQNEIREGKTFELAYTMQAMYFNYAIGASEQNYLRARNELMKQYLISYSD